MEFLIIAFRSREESVKFSRLLNKYGVSSSLSAPPKEAGLSCGLSVRTEINYFYAVKNLLSSIKTKTFVGVFKVKTLNGRNVVTTIY